MNRDPIVQMVIDELWEKDRIVVLPKRESKLMRFAVSRFARKIPFLGKWLKRFYTNYSTTIGYTIYTSDTFEQKLPIEQVLTLRHERKHIYQSERTFFLMFAFLYLFMPLPLGFAYFRAKYEFEAYEVQLRHKLRLGHSKDELKAWLYPKFTGPDYGWMMPFTFILDKWLDEFLDRVQSP